MKVLLSSVPKNGQTAWFDPQTEKLEPHCIIKQTASQGCPNKQLEGWFEVTFFGEVWVRLQLSLTLCRLFDSEQLFERMSINALAYRILKSVGIQTRPF